MAEEELRETDEIRENAIRAIREWAVKNPRICTLRLDAKFILRFLRAKKFSIPMTQEVIERYLVLRKYFFEGEFIYQNYDYKQPELLRLLSQGWVNGAIQESHKFHWHFISFQNRLSTSWTWSPRSSSDFLPSTTLRARQEQPTQHRSPRWCRVRDSPRGWRKPNPRFRTHRRPIRAQPELRNCHASARSVPHWQKCWGKPELIIICVSRTKANLMFPNQTENGSDASQRVSRHIHQSDFETFSRLGVVKDECKA